MIHHVEVQVLVLLLIAAFVGMGARRLHLPYTLALVAAGLVLGFIHIEALDGLELNKDMLLLLFLPALLFEAALHIEPQKFRRNAVPILTLAVPGVLIAVTATAGLLYLGLRKTGLVPTFGWPEAFLLASVIAATDPISVLALFKELGVPKRLYLLVEGESLLNDGVAVVVFVIVAAVLGLGGGHGASHVELHGASEIAAFGLRTFLWMVGGGVVIGLLVGGAVSTLTRQIDDHLIEVTLTTLVAYGSFLLAEEIGASGVLSTVCAGVVIGSFGRHYGMSVATRIAVRDFWEYAAFLANSFIFLLVGLELDPPVLFGNGLAIAVTFAAVLIGRAVVVYGGIPIANRFAEPVSLAWRHVMVWGGLRGSLSMVLIISLPLTFEGRGLLVNLVFGVVATSLFLQGLTVSPLLGRLGLLKDRSDRLEYEQARVATLAASRALETLEELRTHGHLGAAAHDQLRAYYGARERQADAEAARHSHGDALDEQLIDGLQQLLAVEREAIAHATQAGLISAEAAEAAVAELGTRQEAVEHTRTSEEAVRRKALDALLRQPDDEASKAV